MNTVGSNLPPLLLGFILARRSETNQTNTVYDPHSSVPAIHCSQSHYGCCPDGHTSAGGPQGLGCPHVPAAAPTAVQPSCVQTRYPAYHYSVVEVTYGVLCLVSLSWLCDRSDQRLFGVTSDHHNTAKWPHWGFRNYFWLKLSVQNVLLFVLPPVFVLCVSYGCCQDGVTTAQGPNKEGCVEYVAPAPTVSKHEVLYMGHGGERLLSRSAIKTGGLFVCLWLEILCGHFLSSCYP